MYDNRTSNTHSRATLFHQGNPLHRLRFYGGWLLWCLCFALDSVTPALAADALTAVNQYPGGNTYFAYVKQNITLTRTENVRLYYKIGSGGYVGQWDAGIQVTLQSSQRWKWAGLSSTSGQVTASKEDADPILYWGTTIACANSFNLVPPDSLKLTYGGNWNHVDVLRETCVVSLNVATGQTSQVSGPTNTPLVNPLEKFFGKTLSVPYFVPSGMTTVDVVIGGQTLHFPVTTEEGDAGGVAMLSIPIPQGWNGAATINGQSVALAPRIAYTGTPGLSLTANPYSELTDALPVGMSTGYLPLPSGVTAAAAYGLPVGMTESTKLPLPVGVTAVTSGSTVADKLPVGVTRTDTSKTWSLNDAVTSAKTTGPTAVASGASTTKESGLSDGDKEAIQDGVFGTPDEVTKPGAGFKDLPVTWSNLKTQAENKLGMFRPMAAGSLPKATSLEFDLNFGAMGNRHVSIDFTQSPFTIIRAIALVVVVIGAGWFFLKFIKV